METETKPIRTRRTVGFTAFDHEIKRWEAKAAADNRTLSQFVRLRLLAADARDEELAPPEKVK